MNNCRKNYGCFDCDKPCEPCGPAAYDCGISIAADPFDNSFWNVTLCGKLHKVKLPTIKETDTRHSINVSNATINYQAEMHNETWTGAQVGSIISLGDLRDTRVDYDTDAMCYELIYHKYGDCGEGCKSLENAWSTFSIDNENALGSQIRYVRGANRYGCPYFLDVPATSSQYWFQGWRGDTNENGYYQPSTVSTLPTAANGDPIVMSQNPTTKAPVVGTLPWNCVIENIFGNLGVAVQDVWDQRQGTAGFGASFDQITGDFQIRWSDWNNLEQTRKAGDGLIKGKLNWDVSFDVKTGNLTYIIHNLYYESVAWTKAEGTLGATYPSLTLKGITFPGATQTDVITNFTYGASNVSQVLNVTIPIGQTIIVAPGQTVGPFNFAYIYVDWTLDDEGYLGVQFASRLTGWKAC